VVDQGPKQWEADQKVYKCKISEADVIEKITQMLGPSGKDSLLVLGQCVAIFGFHGVHRVVRATVGCLDCIMELLRRIGISMGLNLLGRRQPPGILHLAQFLLNAGA